MQQVFSPHLTSKSLLVNRIIEDQFKAADLYTQYIYVYILYTYCYMYVCMLYTCGLSLHLCHSCGIRSPSRPGPEWPVGADWGALGPQTVAKISVGSCTVTKPTEKHQTMGLGHPNSIFQYGNHFMKFSQEQNKESYDQRHFEYVGGGFPNSKLLLENCIN